MSPKASDYKNLKYNINLHNFLKKQAEKVFNCINFTI